MALPAILAFVTTAAAETAREAVVTGLRGNATYQMGGAGDFIPLAARTRLGAGDVVRTGPQSHVNVRLGSNLGVIHIAPNSTFALKKLAVNDSGAGAVSDTQLDLRSGALYARVNRLPRGSVYEISTPRGIAGIRGTDIYITSEGCLTVGNGTAAIAYPSNGGVQTHVVNGGSTICPGDAAPRPAPADLLQDIDRVLNDATRGDLDEGAGVPRVTPPLEPFVSPTLPGD